MFGAPGAGPKSGSPGRIGIRIDAVAALVDEVEAVIDELAEDREQGIERRDEDGGVAGIAELDRRRAGEIRVGRWIHVHDQVADDARRSVDDVERLGVVVADPVAGVRRRRRGLAAVVCVRVKGWFGERRTKSVLDGTYRPMD